MVLERNTKAREANNNSLNFGVNIKYVVDTKIGYFILAFQLSREALLRHNKSIYYNMWVKDKNDF